MKKRWRPDLDRGTAIRVAVEALYDASQEDVATGGPNPLRGIYPSVKVITSEGFAAVDQADVAEAFNAIVSETHEAPKDPGGSAAKEVTD